MCRANEICCGEGIYSSQEAQEWAGKLVLRAVVAECATDMFAKINLFV
jgi:hypothetical protein